MGILTSEGFSEAITGTSYSNFADRLNDINTSTDWGDKKLKEFFFLGIPAMRTLIALGGNVGAAYLGSYLGAPEQGVRILGALIFAHCIPVTLKEIATMGRTIFFSQSNK